MSGPGVSVPDVTEGITRIEDLPQPRIESRSRNDSCRRRPFCGGRAGRWRVASRTVHDLGDPRCGRPIDLQVRSSTHRRPACRRRFSADPSDLAPPKAHDTHRVRQTAVRLVVEDGRPDRMASGHLGRDHRVFVPWATIQNGIEAAGEKKPGRRGNRRPRAALGHFSGDLAADELYDGPFRVLSLVDNRAFVRLSFRVLEPDPTQDDLRSLWADFKARRDAPAWQSGASPRTARSWTPSRSRSGGPTCRIRSGSSTSSRKFSRRCRTAWPPPARNCGPRSPSRRAADPARPSQPRPARSPGNNSR